MTRGTLRFHDNDINIVNTRRYVLSVDGGPDFGAFELRSGESRSVSVSSWSLDDINDCDDRGLVKFLMNSKRTNNSHIFMTNFMTDVTFKRNCQNQVSALPGVHV